MLKLFGNGVICVLAKTEAARAIQAMQAAQAIRAIQASRA